MIAFPPLAVAAAAAGSRLSAAAPARLTLHAADAKLLQRVLAQTGVARTPSKPSVGSYLGSLIESFMRWVIGVFTSQPGLTEGLVEAAKLLAVSILVLTATMIVLLIARRLRARRALSGPSVPSLEWKEVLHEGPSRDPREWRRRIEERLRLGDIAGALEALWWWLAVSLAPEAGVDASWTTRELLQRARRTELLPMGSRLDVLMYGPAAPSPAEIQACLARLEERLA